MKKLSELTNAELIEIYWINKHLKDEAVKRQDFPSAVKLRDKESKIISKFTQITDEIDFEL